MLAPWRSHRIALGVQGSYLAIEPIIDKYRPYAAAIYFPYPRKLTAAPPQGDGPGLMTMVFEVDQLARAAHAAAPPESARQAARPNVLGDASPSKR
jgi:hypothetical protein